MKKTAIIILNYNNPSDTINCIKSVEKHNSAPVKYVVVDNGSTKSDSAATIHHYLSEKFSGSYLRIEENIDPPPAKLPYVTLLVSKTNDGYARGNNKGLVLVENDDEVDRILILNNDILFVDDVLPPLSKIQDSLTDCAIISPLLLRKNGIDIDYHCARLDLSVCKLSFENLLTPFSWIFQGLIDKAFPGRMILYGYSDKYPSSLQIELPSGACMLLRKDVFKEIGYFDPNTFLYYEENILYQKTLKLRLKNYILTDVRAIHLGGSTTSKSPSNMLVKTSMKSQKYYVKTYLRPKAFAFTVFRLSQAWVNLSSSIKTGIKHLLHYTK